MRKRAHGVVAFTLAVVVLLCGCSGPTGDVQAPEAPEESRIAPVSPRQSGPPVLECLYFDESTFFPGISQSAVYKAQGTPVGGIIPHHLLATDMIAGYFSMVAPFAKEIDRVILLSPSHFPQNCGSDVVTALADWNTPFGKLPANRKAVNALLSHPYLGAENNPAAVELDHGAAGLIPYLSYYLPEVEIAVCLLANSLDTERLDYVEAVVAEQCADGRTLLIISTDFSHYLTPEQAAIRDGETAEAIAAWDLPGILQYNDDHIDSPQSLHCLLAVGRDAGWCLVQMDHSSSVEKLPHSMSSSVYDEGITTYFVYGAFEQKEAAFTPESGPSFLSGFSHQLPAGSTTTNPPPSAVRSSH